MLVNGLATCQQAKGKLLIWNEPVSYDRKTQGAVDKKGNACIEKK